VLLVNLPGRTLAGGYGSNPIAGGIDSSVAWAGTAQQSAVRQQSKLNFFTITRYSIAASYSQARLSKELSQDGLDCISTF
jgi:hypothetical protein